MWKTAFYCKHLFGFKFVLLFSAFFAFFPRQREENQRHAKAKSWAITHFENPQRSHDGVDRSDNGGTSERQRQKDCQSGENANFLAGFRPGAKIACEKNLWQILPFFGQKNWIIAKFYRGRNILVSFPIRTDFIIAMKSLKKKLSRLQRNVQLCGPVKQKFSLASSISSKWSHIQGMQAWNTAQKFRAFG